MNVPRFSYKPISLLAAVLLVLVLPMLAVPLGLAQPYEVSSQPRPGIQTKFIDLKTQQKNLGFDQAINYQLHYAYAGDESKPGILFVHGTPGNWQAFAGYLSDPALQSQFFMVSIDRLGWGYSVPNGSQTSPVDQQSATSEYADSERSEKSNEVAQFDVQAKSIRAVMNQYPQKKWLIVGHSLGASIAPKVALLEPERTQGLLLLAGSHQPSLGRARWYNIAASLMVVKWILPTNLKESNDEIMALRQELTTLENELSKAQLSTQVIVMQGMKDRLVSPKNSAYAKEQWRDTFPNLRIIDLANAGHFLPWEHANSVRTAIHKFQLTP